MEVKIKNGKTVEVYSDEKIDLKKDGKAIDNIVASFFSIYKELINPNAKLKLSEVECNRFRYDLGNGSPKNDSLSFTYFLSRGYSVSINFLDDSKCKRFFEHIEGEYKKMDINYSC